jgi:hypothetical protein
MLSFMMFRYVFDLIPGNRKQKEPEVAAEVVAAPTIAATPEPPPLAKGAKTGTAE